MAQDIPVEHDHAAGAAAWLRGLDVIVWVSVGIIVILGAEWLGGYLVRERIGREARRYLDKVDEHRRS